MFKPVLPYVTDFMAHLLFFKDHMATVHAHNGKYHVHIAVAEGAKNDQSEKNTNNIKKDNVATDHIMTETCKMAAEQISSNYLYSRILPVIERNVHQDYPPPKV